MLTLTQIVVTSKLGNMEHLALKMLTKRLKADEAAAFINNVAFALTSCGRQ